MTKDPSMEIGFALTKEEAEKFTAYLSGLRVEAAILFASQLARGDFEKARDNMQMTKFFGKIIDLIAYEQAHAESIALIRDLLRKKIKKDLATIADAEAAAEMVDKVKGGTYDL